MFGNIGTGELLLIFLVVLLVFGAKRIPEIARGLGKGIREFKDATREISNELKLDPGYSRPAPRPPAQGTPAARAADPASLEHLSGTETVQPVAVPSPGTGNGAAL